MSAARVALFAISIAFGAAACAAASTASPAASATAASSPDPSARALRNQRLRKCTAMTGDEKAACQHDANTVATKKARKDARQSASGPGAASAH